MRSVSVGKHRKKEGRRFRREAKESKGGCVGRCDPKGSRDRYAVGWGFAEKIEEASAHRFRIVGHHRERGDEKSDHAKRRERLDQKSESLLACGCALR